MDSNFEGSANPDLEQEESELSSHSEAETSRKVVYLPAFDGALITFESTTDLIEAINRHARAHGYAVVVKHTRIDKTHEKKPRRVELRCDRHSNYKPAKRVRGTKRRKKTSTRKTACSMHVDGYRDLATGRWYVKLYDAVERDGILVCAHNHDASDEASSHPVHRRMDMTDDVGRQIIVDAEVGIRPTQTLARLKLLYPAISLRVSDISNTRLRVERERVGDKTRTEYLLGLLQQHGAIFQTKIDSEDHLSHLFFANQEVLDVFCESPDLILLDCTYKTNTFGMPLLNMIGVSGMNTTTHLAQAFLRGEATDDYVWVLTTLKDTLEERSIALPNVIFVDRDLALLAALAIVFPDVPVLLCLWHVIKAVETHARRTFRRVVDEAETKAKGSPVYVDSPNHREFCDKFLELVRANTLSEYDDRRAELHALSPIEATYIDTTWLTKWRGKIVRLWTNNVRHFGLQTTSRVEGYHRSFKRWLDTSAGDLLSLYFRLQAWWNVSLSTHRDAISDKKVKTRIDLKTPLFRAVREEIHNYAMSQCVTQLDLITNAPCSGIYTKTTGLPCVHKLRELTRSRQPLVPYDFDVHWWTKRSDWDPNNISPAPPRQVLDPEVSARRRAEQERSHTAPHTRGVGVNGTRRAPSAFELSEGAIPSLSALVHTPAKRLCVLPPIRFNS